MLSRAGRIPPNSPIPTRRYEAPPPANPERVGGFPSRSGGEPRTHKAIRLLIMALRSASPQVSSP